MGKHGEAMSDYREAMSYAEAASYPSARLGIGLLAAKTAAMRLGERERARDFLAVARGLLDYLREPLLSPRRAAYHEILAAVLKREGKSDAALVHQGYALLVYGWRGDELDVGRGYANLGTIYELRNRGSDIALARFCYERALQALADRPSSPEWFEAAFNLGHWLVQNGRQDEQPRAGELLQRVRAESEDAEPSALTDLVLLAIVREDATTARTLAGELEALLDGDSSRSLSAERRLDAWQNIAIAHALNKDLLVFEHARAAFVRVAQETITHGSTGQVDDVQHLTLPLDTEAALKLKEAAPERALALATSVWDYLAPLPEEERPPDMLETVEQLITELRTPTLPATHP
jgi:tetratricopeptide (TPR) repeat protein